MYTKGEWRLIEDEATFQIYVPTKSTVAKIHKRWGDDSEADAHLIAAAPLGDELAELVINLSSTWIDEGLLEVGEAAYAQIKAKALEFRAKAKM